MLVVDGMCVRVMMKTGKKNRCEALAKRLFRRWVRAVAFARSGVSHAAAYRRYGLRRNEFREAFFDLDEPRGEVRLWRRAKRTAVRRLEQEIAAVAIRVSVSFPDWGRDRVARAVRERGFAVGASTVRRMLLRYEERRRAS